MTPGSLKDEVQTSGPDRDGEGVGKFVYRRP